MACNLTRDNIVKNRTMMRFLTATEFALHFLAQSCPFLAATGQASLSCGR
jgi:hypothetical protein